jgi:hypothetical protein
VVHTPEAQSEWAAHVWPSRARQTDEAHFCRLEHAEQPPQCWSLLVVSKQVPPQLVWPPGQQIPFELICPWAQQMPFALICPGAQQMPLALICPCVQQSLDKQTPVPQEC